MARILYKKSDTQPYTSENTSFDKRELKETPKSHVMVNDIVLARAKQAKARCRKEPTNG